MSIKIAQIFNIKLNSWYKAMGKFRKINCIVPLRLGIGPSREEEERNTEEEVNDYLARAIDARSIDRLRSEHCKRFFLSFRDKEIEVSWGQREGIAINLLFLFI